MEFNIKIYSPIEFKTNLIIFKPFGLLNPNISLKIIKIFLVYFIFLSTIINCYIKIPIKYYPSKIFNETNPSNTMHSLIVQRLYATIELGSPKQYVQIPIEFETNDFYISESYELTHDEKCELFNIDYFNFKINFL